MQWKAPGTGGDSETRAALPGAGWHPDPLDPERCLRWWSGTTWTARVVNLEAGSEAFSWDHRIGDHGVPASVVAHPWSPGPGLIFPIDTSSPDDDDHDRALANRTATTSPPPEGRVLKNTAFGTLAEVGGKIATFLLFAVVARELGSREFGEYALAFTIAALAVTFADWGLSRLLVREVARDPDAVRHIYGNTLALRAVVGLVLVLIVVAAAPALGFESKLRLLLLFAGLGTVIDLMTGTCFAVFQAFRRMGFLPIVLVTQRWLTAVLGITAVLLGADVEVLAAVYLSISAISFLGAVWLTHRYVVPTRLNVQPGTWLGMLRRATPMGVAGLFGVVLFRIDTAMLGALASKRALGDYAAAYRLLETTLFLSFSLGAAAFPAFAQRSPTSDPPIVDVYSRTLKLALALTLPIALGFGILADPVLSAVFGEGFHRADDALVLLAPAIVFYPLGFMSLYLALSQDREREVLVITAVVAIGNVVANLIVIPRYSLLGAAANTSAFDGAAAVLTIVLARRVCGPMPWTRILAGPLIAAAAAAGVMVALSSSFVVAAGSGAVVYLGVLLAFERLVFADELHALRALLSRSDPDALAAPQVTV